MKLLIRHTAKIAAVFSLAAALSAGITACGDSDRNKSGSAADAVPAYGPAVIDDSVELDSKEVCESTVHFGDISAISDMMQDVLRQRFPNRAAAAEADIIFCAPDEYASNAAICKKAGIAAQ
ncbi:MAG: hypothetical protein Q4F00_02985 [bacterium]|nr:hypothetical protein [bacterium]